MFEVKNKENLYNELNLNQIEKNNEILKLNANITLNEKIINEKNFLIENLEHEINDLKNNIFEKEKETIKLNDNISKIEDKYNLIINDNKQLETNILYIKDDFNNQNSVLNEENKIYKNEIIMLNKNKEEENDKI